MIARDLLEQLVKCCLLPVGALRRDKRPGVMVLGYHRVAGGSARPIDLPADLFAWQVAYLHAHYRLVSLDEVVRVAREGRAYPDDLVALTFDDGYEEVYLHAFPILLRYRVPATVYLATAAVEEGRPFPFEAALPPQLQGRPLSWAQAREMKRSGLITFGAHTHTHVDLTSLPLRLAEEEIRRANALIAERLGAPPAHFSYPWGLFSGETRALVDRNYSTAVIGGTRKNRFGAIDLGALQRVPIQRSDGRALFRLKLSGYLFAEEWLRGGAGPVRSAGPEAVPPSEASAVR
ncbi:MAG TPA: polysaccharide deacetylase family protein [bacterium]|jgi:peptidoglycan/xylan/chitin deacetylase (PgdA/CDA1 family)|nr:polysaccharide deacetylase family protein [bacterium]